MINFEESYFKEEEIEGFHVTEMMKRYWASNLEILMEIDRICRKNNIKYFLYFGTLLGAVRHKGFIPWDDDMDIAMFRDDYEKFLEISKTEMQSPFFIDHAKADSCLYTSCVHNTYWPQIDEKFLEQFHGCPYTAGIDVFPIDNIPDDEKELDTFFNLYMIVRYLSQRSDPRWKNEKVPDFVKSFMDHPSDEDMNEVLDKLEKYLDIEIVREGDMYIRLAEIANELAKKYRKKKCKKVAYINDLEMPVCDSGIVPKRAFDNIVELEFEGVKLPVPGDYEKVLECLYGKDWRTPVQGGASHDYPVYKKQADVLKQIFDAYKAPAPDYFYL